MRTHPGETLRRSFIKFADFWGLEREYMAGVNRGIYRPPFWLGMAVSALIVAAYVVVVAAGAAGIWLARPDIRTHVLLLLPVVVTMGAHTIVFGHSRYHLPLMPIFGLYGAALFAARERISWRSHRVPFSARRRHCSCSPPSGFVSSCWWTRAAEWSSRICSGADPRHVPCRP